MNRFGKQPELSRSSTPPSKPGVWWVDVPKGSESLKYTVYSPEIQGVNQHYIIKIKRTVPCFTDTNLCPGGHTEGNRKWRGYVFAYSHARHKRVFVQLTNDAIDSWMSQLRETPNLRGQSIIVHRSAKDNGRIWVEVESWRSNPKEEMPLNQDCMLSLYDMWHFDPSSVSEGVKIASAWEMPLNGHVLK